MCCVQDGKHARELIKVMTEAGQNVPPELMAMQVTHAWQLLLAEEMTATCTTSLSCLQLAGKRDVGTMHSLSDCMLTSRQAGRHVLTNIACVCMCYPGRQAAA